MTSYIYIFRVNEELKLRIGSLGMKYLPKGYYAYIGSANIKRPFSRILRHYASRKRVKWHIDYITTTQRTENLLSIICYDIDEERLYRFVMNLNLCKPFIRGFGSTDRKGHTTHLFIVHNVEEFTMTVTYHLLGMCNSIELVLP